MRWIHPNVSYAVRFAALVVSIGASGCRSQSSGGLPNPFLAPDRVPPPATRAILPGQAQPYYPGDPLPVMQSNAAPVTDERGIAWNAPNNGPAAALVPAAKPKATFTTESLVAIPTDDGSLRFDLPAATEPAPVAPQQPPPVQVAAVMPDPGVAQASYSEPVLESTPPAPNPWRQPQIVEPALPPPPRVVQQFIPQPSPSLAAAPEVMDVRLRAVASPPAEPGQIPTPRIRFSGEVVPQMASNDGFRPRTSTR